MLGTLLQQRYKIISVLGVGGFGQTYLADDLQHPDPVRCVIKHFKPNSQDPRFLKTARRLFHTEVSTLRQLSQHPQIPDFLDFLEESGEFYLVQQFIEGHALTYEFASTGKLSESRAIDLLREVLEVLAFVHANQVIHRDIKPANLLRRQQDGKIFLIDFGAVKAIQTQLLRQQSEGQTGFTVGIGTQGYSPSEQLAGQPRLCSDIYALGVTLIQAVTGLHPTQLPINPDTGELVWQDYAAVNPGFAAILEQMVRYHFSQRFQSAEEVQMALQHYCDAALEATDIPWLDLDINQDETRLPDQTESQDETLNQRQGWFVFKKQGKQREQQEQGSKGNPRSKRWRAVARQVAGVSLAATAVVLGVRQLGGLEAGELAAYDQMVRLRPAAEADPRLLIVGISEQDLQTLQRPTPADRDVAQVIDNLSQAQPRVLGLDLHRELPQEPGHTDLIQQLQAAKVVTVLKLGDETVEIPPPAGVPADRTGFSDIVVDRDGVIRRNLMLASLPNGEPYVSFSLQLAFQYLRREGIMPRSVAHQPDILQIGDTSFLPLQPNSGGYQHEDTAGYQILLDYRSPDPPARMISFTQALRGEFDPDWVKDKIVLIGTIAPSSKDLFFTPYSAGQISNYQMPGVVLHAQMVAHLLQTTLDGKPIFWFLPDWAEATWIAIWAAIGGGFAWWIHHPMRLAASIVGLVAVLAGVTLLLFLGNLWLPLVAPALAVGLTSVTIVAYRGYKG